MKYTVELKFEDGTFSYSQHKNGSDAKHKARNFSHWGAVAGLVYISDTLEIIGEWS